MDNVKIVAGLPEQFTKTGDPGNGQAEMAVGTPPWDVLTERRAELIFKKNREDLTADETVELERLQQLSSAAISREFPVGQSALDAKLSAIEKALAEDKDPSKQ